MRTIVPLALLGASLLATGCGGGATDAAPSAVLYAVNGARYPAVFSADTVTWAGYGFGAEQGAGDVIVTTGQGPATASVVSWRDAEVRAVIPQEVATGPTVLFTAIGDSLGPLDLFVRPRTSYDPAARPWLGDAALPVPLASTAAAAVHFPGSASVASLVVVSGGTKADSTLNRSTYLGFINQAGRLAEWREAPDTVVPIGRRLHVMAGADRASAVLEAVDAVAYMAGGLDSAGRVLADVLGLGLGADASYGLWTSLAPLPDRRAGAAAATAFSKVYVIGGFGSDSLAARSVSYATILPSGTLNGWLRGPDLPEGRAFASAVVVGSTLLVLGGERGLVDPDAVTDSTQLVSTVHAIGISALSGAFRDSSWTTLPVTLRLPRSRGAAFAVDDVLIVTGGVYSGMPSSAETEYAVLVDGLPGTFLEFPGESLASLAGGATWLPAAPVVWDASGVARVTLVGGFVNGIPSALTWSQ